MSLQIYNYSVLFNFNCTQHAQINQSCWNCNLISLINDIFLSSYHSKKILKLIHSNYHYREYYYTLSDMGTHFRVKSSDLKISDMLIVEVKLINLKNCLLVFLQTLLHMDKNIFFKKVTDSFQ